MSLQESVSADPDLEDLCVRSVRKITGGIPAFSAELATATAEVFSLPNATEALAIARVAREFQVFAAISVPVASPDSSPTASLATNALETGTALCKTWPPAPETWHAAAKTST